MFYLEERRHGPNKRRGRLGRAIRKGRFEQACSRGYWMDMPDSTLVMVMTKGIGANPTNDEKRAHLIDLKREHLIEQVCPQEILPPEK
jgi:hypothetical protein